MYWKLRYKGVWYKVEMHYKFETLTSLVIFIEFLSNHFLCLLKNRLFLFLISFLFWLYLCYTYLMQLNLVNVWFYAENSSSSGMRPPTLNIFPSQPMHVEPSSSNSKVWLIISIIILISIMLHFYFVTLSIYKPVFDVYL
jgi:hypothetical protein